MLMPDLAYLNQLFVIGEIQDKIVSNVVQYMSQHSCKYLPGQIERQ